MLTNWPFQDRKVLQASGLISLMHKSSVLSSTQAFTFTDNYHNMKKITLNNIIILYIITAYHSLYHISLSKKWFTITETETKEGYQWKLLNLLASTEVKATKFSGPDPSYNPVTCFKQGWKKNRFLKLNPVVFIGFWLFWVKPIFLNAQLVGFRGFHGFLVIRIS